MRKRIHLIGASVVAKLEFNVVNILIMNPTSSFSGLPTTYVSELICQ
jgi:hypothetical protein